MEWFALPMIVLAVMVILICFPRVLAITYIFTLFLNHNWLGVDNTRVPGYGTLMMFLLVMGIVLALITDLRRIMEKFSVEDIKENLREILFK